MQTNSYFLLEFAVKYHHHQYKLMWLWSRIKVNMTIFKLSKSWRSLRENLVDVEAEPKFHWLFSCFLVPVFVWILFCGLYFICIYQFYFSFKILVILDQNWTYVNILASLSLHQSYVRQKKNWLVFQRKLTRLSHTRTLSLFLSHIPSALSFSQQIASLVSWPCYSSLSLTLSSSLDTLPPKRHEPFLFKLNN